MLLRPSRRLLAWVAATVCGTASIAAFGMAASADDAGEYTLKPGQQVVLESTRPMGTNPLGAGQDHTPEACREDPSASVACDTYRFHFELDPSAEAFNFVRFQLDYETPRTPPMPVVAAGLTSVNVADLNLYVYDITGEEPVEVEVTGATAAYEVPAIAAFEPKVRDFDVVVVNTRGPLLGYTFTIDFSNEVFGSPFEALDPSLVDRSADRPVDLSATPPAAAPAAIEPASPSGGLSLPNPVADAVASVAPASVRPVAPDTDFAGFRGSVDDAVGAAPQIQRTQPVAFTAPAPSAPIVLFWLLAVPLAVLAAIWAWMRRRMPSELT